MNVFEKLINLRASNDNIYSSPAGCHGLFGLRERVICPTSSFNPEEACPGFGRHDTGLLHRFWGYILIAIGVAWKISRQAPLRLLCFGLES